MDINYSRYVAAFKREPLRTRVLTSMFWSELSSGE
jgi:hypothetical protein